MLALTVARLQLQELLRRRLFLVLLLLTLVVISLTTWGFSRIPTLDDTPMSAVEIAAVASQFLILVMFMFSFVLAFSAVFAASPAISAEVESGITLAMLARPITRLEYVVGKWLGLVATVLIYAIPAASVQMILVQLVVGYSPPHPIEFLAFVIGEAMVVLTLSLLLSTRFAGMVGGVTGLILWGLAWMGGIVGGIGLGFGTRRSRMSGPHRSCFFRPTASGAARCGASSPPRSSPPRALPVAQPPRIRSSRLTHRPPRTSRGASYGSSRCSRSPP